MPSCPSNSRRKFLKNTGLVAAAGVAAPAILTAKRTAAQNVIGTGDLQFHYDHQWAKLPKPFHWQTTHNVAVDPDGHVYVIHQGKGDLPEHPAIFVFDPDGRLIRSFGQQFQGGGHGLEVHVEDGTPYLYVAGYIQTKTIAKLTLDGELVWQQYAPMRSDVYADGEASNPTDTWGRDRFQPTNFAFLDDEFLVADGYGSYFIHRYNYDGRWLGCFGGPGEGKGTFQTPHGLWVDDRPGADPELVVCDRAHNTLQALTLDGKYKKTVPGFGLPANVDTYKDQMVVPELVAQVSLVDRNHNVVATLGSDQQRILEDKKANGGFVIRTDESKWRDGKFIHPHDACFDADGNIFVTEWVTTGRVTKLTLA